MFQITSPPRSTDWVVIGPIFGQDAVIFRGTVLACILFVKGL